MGKNNFLLYKDYKPNVDILSDEQAGKLFKAIFSYVEDRTEPNFKDGMLTMAFQFIRTQLERDLEKYKERVEINRENGAKGGRPNQTKQKKPKKPNGLNKKQSQPKKGDNDYVYDNVFDYDYVNDREDIKELFYDFLTLRKKLKAINTHNAIKIQEKKITNLPTEVQKQMLENAIGNSWKSLYPLKDNKGNKSNESFKPDWLDNQMNNL